MKVEIYADVWCPFAHVSLRTLAPLRDEMAPGTPLLVRAWPLELINEGPLDPDITAAHIAELRRDVAPGLFSGFRPSVMPDSTLKALALVEGANEVDPWLGERISFELRDALFERGMRIDIPMLAELARGGGLPETVIYDRELVEARLAEGRSRGVQGSPHIFIDDIGMFCPLLEIVKDDSGALHITEQFERLKVFLSLRLGR